MYDEITEQSNINICNNYTGILFDKRTSIRYTFKNLMDCGKILTIGQSLVYCKLLGIGLKQNFYRLQLKSFEVKGILMSMFEALFKAKFLS